MNCGIPCPGSCCEKSMSSITSTESSSGGDRHACCCCRYDPFEDDSAESHIKDLAFALRKLSVMKCQMKKWRLERLQLESENRSLKLELKNYGVEPDTALKPDPLLAHLRAENARLRGRKDDLVDEIRDLQEALDERDRCDTNTCDAVAYVREKILDTRRRFLLEKRQLRETIANLQIRLDEAKEDGSCEALNRLRAKLRELMKEGKKGEDHQPEIAVVKKSIETMVELSKGCDELKRDNERLLAEIEALKKQIKEEEKFVRQQDLEVASAVDISDLMKRVNACEALVSQLRAQLAEKDDIINCLQKKLFSEKRNSTKLEHDLDQITVSQKALLAEIEAMKAELKEKDAKVTQLIRELRKSTSMALSVGELENQLDRMRPEMQELETHRDQLMDELSSTRKELSNKNNEIIRILEERKKKEEECRDDLKKALEEKDACALENERLKKMLEELENQLKGLADIDALKAELERLRAENEQLKAELAKAKEELAKQKGESDDLQKENDDLLKRLKDLESQLEKLKNERDALKAELAKAKEELAKQKDDSGGLKKENDDLLKRLKDLENQLEKLKNERDALKANEDKGKSSLQAAQNELAKLRDENAALKKKIDDLNKELAALKEALEKARRDLQACKDSEEARRKELEAAKAELVNLRQQNEKLHAAGDAKSDLEGKVNALTDANSKLNAELEKLKARLAELEKEIAELTAEKAGLTNALGRSREENERLAKELEACKKHAEELEAQLAAALADKDRLEREVGDLKWQLDKLKKDLKAEQEALADLEKQLKTMKAENDKLKSENAKQAADLDKLKKNLESATAQVRESQNELKAAGAANKQLKSSVDKVKSTGERLKSEANLARRQSQQLKNELSKMRTSAHNIEAAKKKEDGSGDFLKQACAGLKAEMQAQIAGVERVTEYIKFLEGKAKKKPEMSKELPASKEPGWPSAEINDLFKRSRKLSEAIFGAELEVQNLGEEAKEDGETSFQQQYGEAEEEKEFDADAWLQSLTLTELAELHDRICLLTSCMIEADDDGADLQGVCCVPAKPQVPPCKCNVEEAPDVLNSRVAALQRRIDEKQLEAAERAAEMRKMLLIKQAEMLRISDEMNRDTSRNLLMQICAEAATATNDCPAAAPDCVDCCAREDCRRAGCSAGDYFDPCARK